jgi:hypothetical protein
MIFVKIIRWRILFLFSLSISLFLQCIDNNICECLCYKGLRVINLAFSRTRNISGSLDSKALFFPNAWIRPFSYTFKWNNLRAINNRLELIIRKNYIEQIKCPTKPKLTFSCADILIEREACLKNFYKILLSEPWGKVAKNYIKQLQEEESILISKIICAFNMSVEDFEICRNLLIQESTLSVDFFCKSYFPIEFLEDNPLSIRQLDRWYNSKLYITEVETIVRPLIEKYCPNLTGLEEMYLFDDKKGAHVRGLYPQTALVITRRDLVLPLEYFRGTILHEIQHILHSDIFYRSFLNLLLHSMYDLIDKKGNMVIEEKTHMAILLKSYKKKINIKEIENLIVQYEIFTEKRADVFSCLVDPTAAKYIAAHIKESYEDNIDNKIVSSKKHLPVLERLALAEKIYAEIKQYEKE